MRLIRLSVVIALALLFASVAFGDSVTDPKIIIQGVAGGSFITCPPDGCVGVGTHFSFNSPQGGTGKLFFGNESGVNWTSLRLIESGVPATAVTCVQNLFLSCNVKTLKDGATEILLSGTAKTFNAHHGILNGQDFAIGFKCSGKGNCWPPGGVHFIAIANAPEPATIALVVSGLAAIVSRRKRWQKSNRS
jgi:hypothetical protein